MRYALALALTLGLTTSAARASFVSGLFNTGVNGTGPYGTGSLIANNASETHWAVSSAPLLTPLPPAAAAAYASTTPVVIGDGPYPLRADGPWFLNGLSPNSKWIVPTRSGTLGVDQDLDGNVSHLNGFFTYSTTFDITQDPGELVTGIRLAGRFGADDFVVEVLLNGMRLFLDETIRGEFNGGFRLFDFSSSAVLVGTNTLSFRTRNTGTIASATTLLMGNPSGFRLEFASADLAVTAGPAPSATPLPAGLPAGLLAAVCFALPARRRWFARAA